MCQFQSGEADSGENPVMTGDPYPVAWQWPHVCGWNTEPLWHYGLLLFGGNFGKGKNISVCTLHCHCTVMCAAVQCSVRSLYSMSGVSVSQLWPEHRMESTGSESCAVTEWRVFNDSIVTNWRRVNRRRDGFHHSKGGRCHRLIIIFNFKLLDTSVLFCCKKWCEGGLINCMYNLYLTEFNMTVEIKICSKGPKIFIFSEHIAFHKD